MSGTGIPLANVGDVLAGKYRVERVLGIGGMGMVVAATHLELDQQVALKFMLPAALTSAQAVERFLREARAVVRLRSEHVCRVFDVGRLDDGAPYIVMELMDGHDLAQLLELRRVLAAEHAVDLVLQALEGIAEAHANGIVHRDLKPANLFIATGSDGSALVKVLDFGISKSTVGGNATRTGDIMGSPSYMAPEQMQSSKNVDVRADVWAMGVVLYEALTGRLPFEEEHLPALLMKVLMEEPTPPTDLPPELAAVVMRCLEKSPARRFPDVGSLATAVAPFGGPGATASAARIVKVLQRAKAGGVQAPEPAWAVKTVVPLLTGTVGRESTLSSSASESLRQLPVAVEATAGHEHVRPTRWVLSALFVGVAGIAIIVVVAFSSMVRGRPTPGPAAASGRPSDAASADATPAPPSRTSSALAPVDTASSPASPISEDGVVDAAVATTVAAPSEGSTSPATTGRPSPDGSTESAAATTLRRTTKSPGRSGPSGARSSRSTAPPLPKPVAASAPSTTGSGDDRPAYKGTKGRVITDYPTE